MKEHFYYSKISNVVFVATFSLTLSGSVLPQERTVLQQATNIALENIQEGIATQERINTIDDQRSRMVSDYRSALKQADDLNTYNDHLRTLIQSQRQEMRSIRSQISRITGLEREVVPLMKNMLDTLEQFIELDVPFLIDDRRNRVANLRMLLEDAGIAKSEKYRRILEAYQIENDYGRHIETYEGTLSSEEGAQIVHFLKIGRVSLMYQTKDGADSYLWDRENKSWQHLHHSYNNQLKLAMRMAKDQIPPNLLFIPVHTTGKESL